MCSCVFPEEENQQPFHLTYAQDFFGMDEGLFRKALSVLENEGRAVIFKGGTSEEDGVKFLG